MAKYVYPAVFTPEKDGGYSVDFPDVKGCGTCGDNLIDAMEMAEDALMTMLRCLEDERREIPPASSLEDVAVEDGEFATRILCDTANCHLTKADDNESYSRPA